MLKVTDEQVRKALDDCNGRREDAARQLGIGTRAFYGRLERMKATGRLVEGVYETSPSGHTLKGISSLIGADGEVKAQWVKTQAGKETREQLLQAVKDSVGDLPKARAIPKPRNAKDLLACYPMGDPHLGMYAWGEESGDDFDLDIAERDLVEATRRLVNCVPPSRQALIVNLGDFFHADTTENKTLRSGNVLDVDTRWAKVLRTGVRVMRACVEAALERHQTVRVINSIGNHDEHTSQMLTLALSMLYEKNRRVEFDESPAKFHYYSFGRNLVGVTHGDKMKPENLGGIMATDKPEEWGKAVFRYWFTGHVHTKRVFELPGCTVESFRTLAAKDAWTASSGYRSGRDMQAIVIDKNHGEVERHRIDISAL